MTFHYESANVVLRKDGRRDFAEITRPVDNMGTVLRNMREASVAGFGIFGIVSAVLVALLGIILGISGLFVIPILLMQGWVLTIMWGWFVVPVFHLQALSLGMAMGLLLVSRLIVPSKWSGTKKVEPKSAKDYSPEEWTEKKREGRAELIGSIAFPFVYPLLLLFVGWVIQSFM